MANNQKRAGLITLKVNGEIHDAKGSFTYGYGTVKREAIIGADGVHGFKETPVPAFIEGAITDRGDLDLKALFVAKNVTISIDLVNEKTFVLRDAWYAGDGEVSTEEAEAKVRWESSTAEEVS